MNAESMGMLRVARIVSIQGTLKQYKCCVAAFIQTKECKVGVMPVSDVHVISTPDIVSMTIGNFN